MKRHFLSAGLFVFLASSAGATTVAEDLPYLGVGIGEVPAALASHLQLEGGVLIVDVVRGSPAERAGLKHHDVVLSIDGETTLDPAAFLKVIRSRRPDDTVTLKVRRGNETLELSFKLGAKDSKPAQEAQRKPGFLGIGHGPVPAPLAAHLGLKKGQGVVVDEVLEDSAAAHAGIEQYDVVLAINGKRVDKAGAVNRIIDEYHAGDTIVVKVVHRAQEKEISVTLGAVPEGMEDLLPEWEWKPTDPWLERPDVEVQTVPPYFRGKIIIRGQDGEERIIEIPEMRGRLKGLGRKLESEYKKHFRNVPGDLQERLKRLTDELGKGDYKFKPDLPGVREGGWVERQETSVGLAILIEDGCEITLRHEDGEQTVTVKKDGETLADGVPLSEIESLPEEVREKVKKLQSLTPDGVEGRRLKKKTKRLEKKEDGKGEKEDVERSATRV